MKVLIEKTLNQTRVVEIPDGLSEEEQQDMAGRLADEMRLIGDCEWLSTDFFREAATDEEKQRSCLDVEDVKMVEWFDVG